MLLCGFEEEAVAPVALTSVGWHTISRIEDLLPSSYTKPNTHITIDYDGRKEGGKNGSSHSDILFNIYHTHA